MGTVKFGVALSRVLITALWAPLILAALHCRPALRSNYGVESWEGTRLVDGRSVRLAELPGRRLVVNVYSPTCVPCVQELPAINALHRVLAGRGDHLVLAVDNRPELHFASGGDAAQLRARLLSDAARYRIEPPILIMSPTFRVSPRDGLISGNPETLIFDTAPLRLRYNFIGPISAARTTAELEADSRYQFVLQQL